MNHFAKPLRKAQYCKINPRENKIDNFIVLLIDVANENNSRRLRSRQDRENLHFSVGEECISKKVLHREK